VCNSEERWQGRDAPLFKRIGYARGGFAPNGGILWSDWEEPRWLGFSQIHGHSIGPIDIRRAKDGSGEWALRLDTGGGKNTSLPLAAAFAADDGVQAFYDETASVDQLVLDDADALDAYADELAASRGW
jgi:hypothetical protein